MKPTEKQLGIARSEGGSAAFNRPKGMSQEKLLALCPYRHKALALAWRNAARLHFSVQHGWSDGPNSSNYEDQRGVISIKQ